MKRIVPLCFGMIFGIALWKAKATDPRVMQGLFLFENFHLAGVMGVAIATAFIGFALLKRGMPIALSGEPMKLVPPPWRPHAFAYGLIFGLGWALTGACPGPAFAALGEGRGYVLVTLAGMLIGTYAWGCTGGDSKLQKPKQARP